MLKRLIVGFVIATGGFGAAAAVQALAAKPGVKKGPGEIVAADVFGLDKIWQFHLDVSAKDYESMQPAAGKRGRGGPGGPMQPTAKPANPNADVHMGSGFGIEFPIVHATFVADGKSFANAGLRYKGNASYMASSRSVKKSMKVELDHFDENAARFHGLRKLNLNSGVMDPTKGARRWHLPPSEPPEFRPRARPTPKSRSRSPANTTTSISAFSLSSSKWTRRFLRTDSATIRAVLMKPERLRGIEYLGEDWDAYKARYQPKHDPTPAEARRIIDFAKLVNQGSDEQFAKEIGSYLDVDEFLRFLGATAMLSNLDSLLTMGHNFYIYLNPMSNKLVFIPWDLDLSLAGFPMAGSPDQQLDLSLNHPYAGQNKLMDRLLAVKAINEQYQQILKELAAGAFSKEKLLADIDTIEKATKALKAKDAKAAAARTESGGGMGFGPPGGPMAGRTPDLKTFVEKRTASISAQLAGDSKGYSPTGGRGGRGGRAGGPGGPGGPGGFMMRPPRPGEVLPSALQDMLTLSDEQKKQLAGVQKEVDAKLDRILTTDQKARLKQMREASPAAFEAARRRLDASEGIGILIHEI